MGRLQLVFVKKSGGQIGSLAVIWVFFYCYFHDFVNVFVLNHI